MLRTNRRFNVEFEILGNYFTERFGCNLKETSLTIQARYRCRWMAIALSGLVKAALAWRAGEKEMIGGWVGGGEGSFVFVLCNCVNIVFCTYVCGWWQRGLLCICTLYLYLYD